MKNRKKITIILAALVMEALEIIISFMPTVILDILMAANLIQALCILLIAVFTGGKRRTRGNEGRNLSKETAVFRILPMLFLLCELFGLVIFVAFTRLILAEGTGADSEILLLVSGLIRMGGIVGITVGFIGLEVICAVVIIAITKVSLFITEVSTRFSMDAIPVKIMVMEHAYNCGEISEETFIARKDSIVQQNDFLGSMDGAYKFVAGSAKVMIIIIVLEILGGIIIGTRFHGQTVWEATETFIAFGFSGGIIFLPPLLLLSIAMCTITNRFV
jgi:flagellar biosynthesis component FlhA